MAKFDYYVYYHFRPDNNNLFYVGIGKGSRYKSKFGRNKLWQSIVNKNGGRFLSVKAIENISYEKACETEILTIKHYGRKIIDNGILCNFSEGGEINKGGKHTDQHRLNISIANKGINKNFGSKNNRFNTKHTDITKSTMADSAKSKILNLETGIYYNGIEEACFSVGMKYGTLRAMLNGKNKNLTSLQTVLKTKYNG